MSRQQRTSIRGSVKTSAFEGLEGGKLASSSLPSSSSWIVLFDIVADLPLSHNAEGYFQKSNRNLLTLPKLDVQMECSRLSLSHPGREDWSLGSEVTAVGFLKATFCGCGVACLQAKNSEDSLTHVYTVTVYS